jgi:hypothetical protein
MSPATKALLAIAMLGAEVETTPATNAVAVSDAPEALTLIVRPPAVAEAVFDEIANEANSVRKCEFPTPWCLGLANGWIKGCEQRILN